MAVKVYAYRNCGTCKKASKWLKERNIDYTEIAIREHPPTKAELKRMLGYMDGNLRKLFNTSGGDYKSMNLKNKFPKLSEQDAIELLSKNGNLVKRPFVLGSGVGTVGFSAEQWSELFK